MYLLLEMRIMLMEMISIKMNDLIIKIQLIKLNDLIIREFQFK